MVALSFQRCFVRPMVLGDKAQSIRRPRQNEDIRAGTKLQLYSGMRTKHCELIGRAVCDRLQWITLEFAPPRVTFGLTRITTLPELDGFAGKDGFKSWDDMAQFWREQHATLTFHGHLITWVSFRPTTWAIETATQQEEMPAEP